MPLPAGPHHSLSGTLGWRCAAGEGVSRLAAPTGCRFQGALWHSGWEVVARQLPLIAAACDRQGWGGYRV